MVLSLNDNKLTTVDSTRFHCSNSVYNIICFLTFALLLYFRLLQCRGDKPSEMVVALWCYKWDRIGWMDRYLHCRFYRRQQVQSTFGRETWRKIYIFTIFAVRRFFCGQFRPNKITTTFSDFLIFWQYIQFFSVRIILCLPTFGLIPPNLMILLRTSSPFLKLCPQKPQSLPLHYIALHFYPL